MKAVLAVYWLTFLALPAGLFSVQTQALACAACEVSDHAYCSSANHDCGRAHASAASSCHGEPETAAKPDGPGIVHRCAPPAGFAAIGSGLKFLAPHTGRFNAESITETLADRAAPLRSSAIPFPIERPPNS